MSFLTCIYYYNNQHRQDLLCKYFEHQLLSCPIDVSLLQPASWIKVKPLEGLESLCPRWTLVYIIFIKTFSIRLFPGPGLSLSFQTSFHMYWELRSPVSPGPSAFVMPFIATLSRLETGQSGQAALISLIYVTAINGISMASRVGTARDQFLSHHQEWIYGRISRYIAGFYSWILSLSHRKHVWDISNIQKIYENIWKYVYTT